jgi:hypothetical protein
MSGAHILRTGELDARVDLTFVPGTGDWALVVVARTINTAARTSFTEDRNSIRRSLESLAL